MYVHELILELVLANIVFVACMSYVEGELKSYTQIKEKEKKNL